MDVALTIFFDFSGVPHCLYCGQCTTTALETLEKEILTGKYEKGFVVKNPDYLKRRAHDPASAPAPAAPAAPAVEAKKGK